MKLRIVTTVAFLFLLLAPTLARAGLNTERLVFVNMTPDAKTTAASGECVRQLKSFLADYEEGDSIVIQKLGETRTRKRAGVPVGGLPFTEWTASQVRRIGAKSAVVLVDCRPEENHFDVLIKGVDRGLTRLRVRNLELTPNRLANIREVIRLHLVANFAL